MRSSVQWVLAALGALVAVGGATIAILAIAGFGWFLNARMEALERRVEVFLRGDPPPPAFWPTPGRDLDKRFAGMRATARVLEGLKKSSWLPKQEGANVEKAIVLAHQLGGPDGAKDTDRPAHRAELLSLIEGMAKSQGCNDLAVQELLLLAGQLPEF